MSLGYSRLTVYTALTGLLLLMGCRVQRSLLYQPGPYTYPMTRAMAKRVGLRPWPGDAADYRGWVTAAHTNGSRGTVVVFHGNAGVAAFRNYYVEGLQPLGWRVVLAEYPGYGGRAGAPTESRLVADGLATVRQARAEFGAPVYVWGESLGAAVAGAVAHAAGPEVSGLALITPWDTLAAVTRVHYGWLPSRILLRDRYDTLAHVAAYRGPVAVLTAARDEIIPEALSRRLYARVGEPRRLWVFEDVGHNDWPSGAHEDWWRQVVEFLETARPTTHDATVGAPQVPRIPEVGCQKSEGG